MRGKCLPRAAGGGRARDASPQRSPPGAPGGTSAVLQAPFPGTLLTSGRSGVPARRPRVLPRNPRLCPRDPRVLPRDSRVLPRDPRSPPAASPAPGGCLLRRASGLPGSDGAGSLRPRGTKTVRNVGPQSPGRAGERGRCHRGERRLEDPPAPLSPSLGLLCGVGPSRRFLGRGLPSPSSPGSLSCVRGWRKALGASRPKPKLPVASSCFPFGKC